MQTIPLSHSPVFNQPINWQHDDINTEVSNWAKDGKKSVSIIRGATELAQQMFPESPESAICGLWGQPVADIQFGANVQMSLHDSLPTEADGLFAQFEKTGQVFTAVSPL